MGDDPDSPRYEYVSYIDEAGDLGLKRLRPTHPQGASEWFVKATSPIKGGYPAELIAALDQPTLAHVEDDTAGAEQAAQAGLSIREAVLSLAKAAFPQSVFAATLRSELERQRGGTLHEKTIGMTLYRLSKDGLMRREGQKNWFYVPPETAETKNPGAVTPGLTNRDDQEEGNA